MLFRVALLRRGWFGAGLITIPMLALLVLYAQVAHALGVGTVKTESYIGQPFFALIPIINVNDMDGLLVEVGPSSITPNTGTESLQSQIVEVDSQLHVRITSEQPINEPYLIFSLQLTEMNQVMSRDFTVLLEVRPETAVAAVTPSADSQRDIASPFSDSNTVANVAIADVLGPYEYAVKGRIPKRFGAVLDGQSLWRVARRINQAMDVSINQMMWALYVYNPDAFSTKSVDSLRAGQYLTIPTFSEVANVSDAQALSDLDRLSSGRLVSNVEVPAAIETAVADVDVDIPTLQADIETIPQKEIVNAEVKENASAENAPSNFKLSGLEDISETDVGTGQEQSLDAINSLAVTVGNLTQELIRKDKQIEFLEDKILALESIAALDASNASAGQANIGLVAANEASSSNNVTRDTDLFAFKPWMIWLGLLSLFLIAVSLFRNRFAGVFARAFARHEDIEFEQRSKTTVAKQPQQESDEERSFLDYSSLAVVKSTLDDNELEGFSYISVNDTEDELALDLGEAGDIDDSVVNFEKENFSEHLSSLVKSKNYDAALDVLEAQRHLMLDSDRYYLERLNIYFEQRDKDSFYNYYSDIESVMEHFDEETNHRISEMVLVLEDLTQKKV